MPPTQELLDRRCLALTVLYNERWNVRPGDIFRAVEVGPYRWLGTPGSYLQLERICQPLVCDLGPNPDNLPPACQIPEVLREQFRRARELFAAAQVQFEIAQTALKNFQELCSHRWEKYRVPNPDHSFGVRNEPPEILDGYHCPLCLAFRPRTPADRCQVCRVCDGPMRHEAYIPGQGEHGNVYRCTACGHEEEIW